MLNPILWVTALVSLAIDESPLLRELQQSFGEVAWVSVDNTLALEIKAGLIFPAGSADLKGESVSTLRRLGRVLTKQPHVSVLLVGGASLSSAEAGRDEKLARNRAGTARNYLIMQMRSTCDSTGRTVGCENLDKRIKARAEEPPVRAVTGTAERAASDRVRILLQF